jgi:hypothetical protein
MVRTGPGRREAIPEQGSVDALLADVPNFQRNLSLIMSGMTSE